MMNKEETMTYKNNQKEGIVAMKNKILFITLLAFSSLLMATSGLQAQTPTPTPTPAASNGTVIGGYEVTSTIEIGVRGLDVNGSHDKFRSDFNYKPGLRLFDSSFLMEDKEGKKGVFDSLLITTSGWNADPTGYLRINMEKTGLYRFDSKVRRVHHFNNLNNHANPVTPLAPFGQHSANTKRNFGDFDLTVFPQNDNFRLRFGSSFSRTNGTAGYNTRPIGDEYPIVSNVRLRATDYRAGVDGKLAGFKLSLTQGYRRFQDETFYFIPEPHPGNNVTNSSRLTRFERNYPIRGHTNYTTFTVQRTFAERLDFTGRFIYSLTDRQFQYLDFFAGRDASNNIIDNNVINIYGDTKRPQSRGDIGITYAVTDKFRISNTFTYDAFRISGGSTYTEQVNRRTAAGGALATIIPYILYHRMTDFKRYVNTFEGDYQFNRSFGINIGYRYTHRKIGLGGFNRTIRGTSSTGAITAINNPSLLCSTLTSDNPRVFCEDEENTTHTLLAGTRIKPLRNWSIFANIERGESDNAFVRLANYNFTNFRIRSNWRVRQFTFNVSASSRDNENPSFSTAFGAVPAGELISNIKNRIFSAYVDWTPNHKFSISSGYTHHRLTSLTDIVVPLAVLTPGFSEFYIRDNYAFVDVTAQPINRVSIFASYRFNKDSGQGDRVSTAPQFIISGYPFQLKMPEVRVAVRLTRNIDWNVGYQYYNYWERLQMDQPFPQNYNAHMPYTSLRIHFGGRRER
jgi:hypothetical protein